MTTTTAAAGSHTSAHGLFESPIRVDRSPAEVPLLALTVIVSIGLWVLAAVTIIGLVYAVMLGLFFFLAHVIFVAHVRGNGVRVGPEQFPELDSAVRTLARRMDLSPVPEVFVMQDGGTLNAFASKFLRSNIVVLFSDLLDACGEDTGARDMIIAHELGHIRAGHLRWVWLILPGSLVPFLGTALSRAREYTCDAIGVQGAGTRDSALLGLAILAAGAQHGPRVNRAVMVRQRADLNTGWMRIGEWFSTHPPLARRMAALDPALDPTPSSDATGTARALLIIGGATLVPIAIAVVAAAALAGIAAKLADPALAGRAGVQPAATSLAEPEPAPLAVAAESPAPPANVGLELSHIQVSTDLALLADMIETDMADGRMPPDDVAGLYRLAKQRHPDQAEPLDPFTGQRYGYERNGAAWVIRAAGPDKQYGTADDIERRSSSE